jgi:predicted enzyme related to lactoylglutathione lyase
MLADFPICFNIPAADMTRAKQFYAEILGLTPVADMALAKKKEEIHTGETPAHDL